MSYWSYVSIFRRKYPVCFLPHYPTALSSDNKANSLLVFSKFGSSRDINTRFYIYIDTFDWYLFQLTVLLDPDFKCCYMFLLCWLKGVITGRTSFVSVIANVPRPAELVIIQFLIRLTTSNAVAVHINVIVSQKQG